MQTEKAKSSHFDRTRGFKNQIFPTLVYIHNEHKIKEKQIEDKIDLFYEKLDIHGKKGRKKESVGGGM